MTGKRKKKIKLSADEMIDRIMGIRGFTKELRRKVFQVPSQSKAGRKPR
jgi:hypothetical protein